MTTKQKLDAAMIFGFFTAAFITGALAVMIMREFFGVIK